MLHSSQKLSVLSATKSKTESLLPLFSSRLAFIFIATGAAIGLGNIWKFPYMVGMHGGSAFVLAYFVCILFIGIPTMIAEILIGKASRQEPVTAFTSLAQKGHGSKLWGLGGLLGIFTSWIALSFYSVVAGWALGYLILSLQKSFYLKDVTEIQAIWSDFLARPTPMVVCFSVFLLATLWVNALGIDKGIEKMSKYVLPTLFIVLIGLVLVAANHGDFNQSLSFMFAFRWQELSADAVLSAMGHAFFTLAVGACAMLAYGRYMPKQACIVRSVGIISLLDVVVALLAGLAIFPILFAHDLAPEAGPGLMFQVLPVAFAQMAYGHIVGGAFFLLLLFSAWTTAIAMVEPILSYLCKKFECSRLIGCVSIGATTWVLGLACVFSFNLWSDYTFFNRSIFECLTDLTSDLLLPLGGLAVAVFVGWQLNAKLCKTYFQQVPTALFQIWWFVLRWATPIGIFTILWHGLTV